MKTTFMPMDVKSNLPFLSVVYKPNYIFIIKAQCHKSESDLRYVNDINHIDLNTVPYIVPAPSITNE